MMNYEQKIMIIEREIENFLFTLLSVEELNEILNHNLNKNTEEFYIGELMGNYKIQRRTAKEWFYIICYGIDWKIR